MSEPRRPSLLGQTWIAFCGNSSGYLVTIVTGIVVARTLGPAGKGIVAYAALVMSLFTTFGAGLQAGIMQECGRNGRPQTEVYAAALRLLGLAMIPIAAGLLIIAHAEPRYASFAYVAIAVPFSVYVQIAGGILLLNRDVRSTIVGGLFPTIGVGALTIPALTLFHGGLTAVLAIWAGMFGAAGIYTLVRVSRFVPALALRASWALVRDQGWFGLRAGSSSLASFLNVRIGVFIVGFTLDARTLGIYTLAVATGELMWQISRPLMWTTMGRIADAERSRAIALTSAVSRNILAVELALAVVIFAVAPWAVRSVYGPAFAESGELVRWLLPGLVLYAAQSPLSYFVLVKEGKPNATLSIQLASVVICATLTLLTLRWLGIYGAALATTLTYCVAAAAIGTLFARYAGVRPATFLVLQREDVARLRRIPARAGS